MKLLLDTHIFLWLIDNNLRLSNRFREAIQDPDNQKFLSVVSVWECVIKYQIGKLDFPSSPERYLPEQRQKHLIKTLSVDEKTISHLIRLPLLHRDPFDRLIMSQALQYDLVLMSEDRAILAYPEIRNF